MQCVDSGIYVLRLWCLNDFDMMISLKLKEWCMALPRVMLDHVTRERQHRPVFKPVSLSAGPGQVWHVQGANGVGKTTLLRIIAGIASHVGQCEVEGSIAYSGHQPGLYGQLTAIENLQYAMLWRAEQRAFDSKAHCAAWQVPSASPVRCLSAGQRQALGLLRLLSEGALCWLLDESIQCLDARKIALWLRACVTHVEHGGLIFLTSHAAQDPLLDHVTHTVLLEDEHVACVV